MTARFASMIFDEPAGAYWDDPGLLVITYGFETYGFASHLARRTAPRRLLFVSPAARPGPERDRDVRDPARRRGRLASRPPDVVVARVSARAAPALTSWRCTLYARRGDRPAGRLKQNVPQRLPCSDRGHDPTHPLLRAPSRSLAGPLLSYGSRYRVGRLLAATPKVGLDEAIRIAEANDRRYVRVDAASDPSRSPWMSTAAAGPAGAPCSSALRWQRP